VTKINLRKSTSFISQIFKKSIVDMNKDERGPQARLQAIAWPSEACAQLGKFPVGECRRTMFYKILGVTPSEPMSVVGKSICDAGNLYEGYHIAKFKADGYLVAEQIPMEFIIPNSKNSVQIRGRMDCIIQHENEKIVIEIKSVGEFKAAKIMGGSVPLPAANNLMQAMLYKYYITQVDAGKALGAEEVYLMYVNRSTNETFYYSIDIDEEGYPIITAYNQAGAELGSVKLKDVKSLEELELTAGNSTSDDARIAELRININDIFKKIDEVYDSVNTKTLPNRDYSMVYNEEQAKREHAIGRLSKVKLNKILKGEAIGDNKCAYCAYRTKCMADSGIRLR
jgi:hypothetical protein